MTLIRANTSGSGGGVSFDVIGQAISQNGTSTTSAYSTGEISGFTIGKTYLVVYDRNSSSTVGGVSNGADVLGSYTYKRVNNINVIVLLIKATSSTITFEGNNNPTFYARLD